MSCYLSLGLFVSFFFHGVSVCSIVYISNLLSDVKPPLAIDFSIVRPCSDCPSPNTPDTHVKAAPAISEEQPSPPPQQEEPLLTSIPVPVEEKNPQQVEVKKPQIEKPEPAQVLPKKIRPATIKKYFLSREEVKLATIEAIPEKVIDEVPNKEIESKEGPVDQIAAISPLIKHPDSEVVPAKVQVNTETVQATLLSPQKQYLKAHFSYIKDAIQLKTSYPRMARKMGWEGKVLLSFVINTSGSVEAIRVIKSCGFKALDQNAIKTVRRCAPFPKPLVRAELTLPITYRLN